MAHAIATEADTQMPPHKDRTEHQMPALTHHPASGRTTAQGRRVERPGSGSPAGPSGQPSHTQDDRRHTNK